MSSVDYDCNIRQSIAGEVDTYLHLMPAADEDNPLTFWRRRSNSLKIMSGLARKVFTISCSSVPVESMFSSMGLMINAKRSSLNPITADMLSVIHDNYGKYFPTK